MSLYIALPVASANSQVIGGAYVFETSSTIAASDISSHIATEPSSINTNIPDVGWTTDQVATADWEYPADSGLATNVRVLRVTSIGSNTSPTASLLNNHKLITEYFHSTHANSIKNDGIGAFTYSRTGYAYDTSNMQFTITGDDIIGLDQVGSTYNSTETIGDWHRTPSNDRGNIYFNGILWDSQNDDDSSSSNEDYPSDYWNLTDFQTNTVNFKDQIIEKISSNSDDILEFLVKNALQPDAIKRLHVQLKNDGIIT